MKTTPMTFPEMKAKANLLRHECIRDRDGDICVRPMAFAADGTREVLHWPMPVDFEAPEKAMERLASAHPPA